MHIWTRSTDIERGWDVGKEEEEEEEEAAMGKRKYICSLI